eukprot:TRINITY_DN60669_c0_g1_i1.p1 TRINITY_DN60669_c0_g1~~TRINITY_DN60669_c0_g1_i1.p1  ORF type:complete len:357 (-),score=70.88 TRINITY_DN60669_c0_g1_i1:42-1112(-)
MLLKGLPGVTVDVTVLLSSLTPDVLTSALKAAASSQGDAVTLRSQGVELDVPQLLKSLDEQSLLAAVRSTVKAWPAAQAQPLLALARAQLEGGGVKLPRISDSAGGKPPSGLTKASTWGHLPSVRVGGLVDAIHEKNVLKVRELLASRADVEQADSKGVKPIILAMSQNSPSGILQGLLEAKADIAARDAQGRTLAHLWSWNLPKSKAALREEQQKLKLLASHNVDLNAHLPVTGDTPVHILARVFNTLAQRARDSCSGGACPPQIDSIEAEKFLNNTELRIQHLAAAGASVSSRNSAGQVPLELVETAFWQSLPVLGGSSAAVAAAGSAKTASFPIPESRAQSLAGFSSATTALT